MADEMERSGGGAAWRNVGLAAAGTVGALALFNTLADLAAGDPYTVLDGDIGHFAWTHGDIFYVVKGQGEPLVLVHGVYAGASSYEYRRVFDRLASQFRVFAFDLLGFGLSERPPLIYTPVLYEDLIGDFVRQVVGGMDHPVHLIASSLGAAFTIRAAAERPGLFNRLALIEPTGMENLANARETPTRAFTRGLLRTPLLGQAFYNVITSRPSIRYYLQSQTYAHREQVSDDMVDYYYTISHQPGGRFAPASFISGTLNTPVSSVYPLLKQPILLCWGKDARFTPLENARAFRQANERTQLRVFDCGGLPQDELPEEFAHEVAGWLAAGKEQPSRG